ncbi:MAG: propionate catabolism operon regulatory protein PrpR [Ottowia sp.]|uniref:propionate catabolism operon regulatory protein PrpR n=1 Tax=Ottowia sp. TaxID=1898956 RepID=UPI003C725583
MLRTEHPERRPRLCFVGYRQIREFAAPVVAEYARLAEIELVDGSFAAALSVARDRLERGLVDAFVSAGSNASLLRAELPAPVATIELSGFDLLQALIQARQWSGRVGVVTYGQTIPELDAVKELLNIEIAQHAYHTPEDANARFDQLRRDGFEVIVGSSLVVELAQKAGLRALLAYSLSSIRKGFDDAVELVRVARLEAGRYEQLNGVLRNLQEAVVAVDQQHRIIAINPPMLRVLGQRQMPRIGQRLEELEPQLSLQNTLSQPSEERGVVQHLSGRDWLVRRAPIHEQGQLVGATLTLHDARDIHDADAALRSRQRHRQNTARHSFEKMVGRSPAFLQAVQTARRYARTDLGVLLGGESGAGKELFAQAMHNASPRADTPFVAVNCAAFPEALLESELFGHEEGAFTGARRGGKRGLFEVAHTGTLFLDEIGDMPLSLQPRLLRALQEREITRLGATASIPVDVRVMAATHQSLESLVAQGRFRQDLYYRIHALRLTLPPLRERADDLALLARVLLARSLRQLGSELDPEQALSPLMPALRRHPWPGNVRELENVCERLAVFLWQYPNIHDIQWSALGQECPELMAHAPADHEEMTADRLAEALYLAGGNRQRTAQMLGISRSTLWRWMRDPQMAGALEQAPQAAAESLAPVDEGRAAHLGKHRS